MCFAARLQTPVAPMPSAAILMASSVVMLKAHSYVATNYAMFQVI